MLSNYYLLLLDFDIIFITSGFYCFSIYPKFPLFSKTFLVSIRFFLQSLQIYFYVITKVIYYTYLFPALVSRIHHYLEYLHLFLGITRHQLS